MTSNVQPLAPRRLLRRSEVQNRVGLSKSTLYLRISAGTFPQTGHPRVVGSVGRIRGRGLDFGARFGAGP